MSGAAASWWNIGNALHEHVLAKDNHQLASLLPKEGLSSEQWNKGILSSGQKWGTLGNLTVFIKPKLFQYHHPVGSPTINMHTLKGRYVNTSIVFDEYPYSFADWMNSLTTMDLCSIKTWNYINATCYTSEILVSRLLSEKKKSI